MGLRRFTQPSRQMEVLSVQGGIPTRGDLKDDTSSDLM